MLADIIPRLASMEQEEHGPYYPRPSLASPSTPDDPGRCVRALTYSRRGDPPAPWPGRFLLLLDDSSWHEELSLDWLRKSSFAFHSYQLPIDYSLPRPIGPGGFCKWCKKSIPNTVLHGHIDALFTDLFGVERLWEHKAVGHFAFDEVLKGTPSTDHLTQGCIYLVALRALNPDIREALLLIKSRSTSAYCEFRFTYDAERDRCHVFEMVASEGINRALDLNYDNILTNALAKFEEVERHVAANTLPARPYRADSWRCLYCLHSNRCWEGYPTEVAARDTDTQLPDELVPLLKEYADASKAKRSGEATTKRLRPRILHALEEQNIRSGIANGYRVTVSATERTTIDPLLLTKEAREAAQKTDPVETLRVSSTNATNENTEGE